MGTWGHRYFENDAAFDYMADIEESDNPKVLIKSILNDALKAAYLESDQGSGVIIAAAYVDKQVNGTNYSEAGRDEPLDIDTFFQRYENVDLTDLRPVAVAALKKVLENNSELYELWLENEEDFPTWRKTVEDLISRLDKNSR